MLRTVIGSLRFDAARENLANLAEEDWPVFLDAADRAYLTPALAVRLAHTLPAGARAHVQNVLARNAARHRIAVSVCSEINTQLRSAAVEFVFLKGLTHWPFFSAMPEHRPQFDVDIFCCRQDIARAQASLCAIGFVPLGAAVDLATDHYPPLIRPTRWRWRDDYYDPEMPFTVELHHTFWNESVWGFSPSDAGRIWNRQVERSCAGLTLPALDLTDAIAYSAWHVLRHLLAGDLRPSHVYELAHALQFSAEDDALWHGRRWGVAEAISFRLAVEWFGCRVHPVARAATESLPAGIRTWFELFRFSPLEGGGKDALILHLQLVSGVRRCAGIAAKKLAPLRLPPPLLLDSEPREHYSRRVITRAWFHLTAAAVLSRSLLRWLWSMSSSRDRMSLR